MTPSADRPLSGVRILLTRPAGRSGTLTEKLEGMGARVYARPTVAFEPPRDGAAAERAVADLEAYHWIVFTSVTGVRSFRAVLTEAWQSRKLGARIVAVGPATAAELQRGGWPADLVASDSRAEGLVVLLRPRVRPGQRVLLVRPEVARNLLPDALRARGIATDAVAFYRTVASAEAGDVAQELCDGRFDVVVFTSPSTFQKLVEAGRDRGLEVLAGLARISTVAIGTVTAEALARAGLRTVAVASRPDDAGLAEAIVSVVSR